MSGRVPSLADLRAAWLGKERGPLDAATRAKLLETARRRMDHGRLREAQDVLDALPRRDPRDAEARFALGLLRRFQGRHDASLAALRAAVRLEPRRSRNHLYLAEALLRRGRVAACLAALERGLAACPPPRPDDEQGLLERYRMNLCALRFAEAARLGDALLARFPPRVGDLPRAAWPVFHEDFELYRRPAAYLDAVSDALARCSPGDWVSYFRVRLLGTRRAAALEKTLRADVARLRRAAAARAWMRGPAAALRLPNP